jgi:hypothetical protein
LWEYWDGVDWVAFAPFTPTDTGTGSFDSTRDLTRSGAVRLQAGPRPSAPTALRGVTSSWVRARPKPDDPDAPSATPGATPAPQAPQIDTIHAVARATVSGFRVAARTEKVPDASGAVARVQLVDDSGSPLLLVDDSGSPPDPTLYKLTDLGTNPGTNPGTVLPQPAAPSRYFTLASPVDATKPVRLRVQTNPVLPGPPDELVLTFPRTDRSYDFDVARVGRLPDLAYGNGIAVDPTSTFAPFGPAPLPGAAFYFTSQELFAKPGATVTLFVDAPWTGPAAPDAPPDVRWEYWNGSVWAPLTGLTGPDASTLALILQFQKSGTVCFTVPANIAPTSVNGQVKPWVRARLADGGYGLAKGGAVTITDSSSTVTTTVNFPKIFPPAVQKFRLAYDYTSPEAPLTSCLTNSAFTWMDRTTQASFGGSPFPVFEQPPGGRPALYLGFTRPFPEDQISLYLDVSGGTGEARLSWEYFDGSGGPDDWRTLVLEVDETQGLSTPGMVQFVWPGTTLRDPEPAASATGTTITFADVRSAAQYSPGDQVAVFQDDNAEAAVVAKVDGTALDLVAPLVTQFTSPLVGPSPPAVFGRPRYWVRVVWPTTDYPQPTDPDPIVVTGIYLNAVRAEQTSTQTRELLGATTGQANESFGFNQHPVLPGEEVEVLELDGPLAASGYAQLYAELDAIGWADRLRPVNDPQTGAITQAWVRWDGRNSFAGSDGAARHYVIDRIKGNIQFGDGNAGMIPPVNPDNVVATYQSSQGAAGNVPELAVKSILGAIAGVQGVSNPVAATGGADGELSPPPPPTQGTLPPPPEQVSPIMSRGPQVLRHRHRAVAPADYEQLARVASPEVALARAVTPVQTGGAVPAGWVQVVIVPLTDPDVEQPQPALELCTTVKDYLSARAAAGNRILVVGPQYTPVGVHAVLVPRSSAVAGELARTAKDLITRFLHPVLGGPGGQGWGFGAAVYRSDVVAELHRQLPAQLDFVRDIRLEDDGVLQPEEVALPADRLPAAGQIQILLAALEGSP